MKKTTGSTIQKLPGILLNEAMGSLKYVQQQLAELVDHFASFM